MYGEQTATEISGKKIKSRNSTSLRQSYGHIIYCLSSPFAKKNIYKYKCVCENGVNYFLN